MNNIIVYRRISGNTEADAHKFRNSSGAGAHLLIRERTVESQKPADKSRQTSREDKKLYKQTAKRPRPEAATRQMAVKSAPGLHSLTEVAYISGEALFAYYAVRAATGLTNDEIHDYQRDP
ncbi:MAG: hypothetical protein WCH05_06030 [Chlorobiaceae bacterium]